MRSRFLAMLWSTRERPRRSLTEKEVAAQLYGRLAFWRTGVRSGWR